MIKTLFLKDINLFFQSPMGFLIISSYWLLAGFFFSFNTVFVSAVDMVSAFHNMCILLLFFTPIITMRCFSEEYRNGTLELFLAYGVNECDFVAAKFLFLICILFILIAGSLPAVGILIIFSEPDLGAYYWRISRLNTSWSNVFFDRLALVRSVCISNRFSGHRLVHIIIFMVCRLF